MPYKTFKLISPSFTNINKFARLIQIISMNENMPSLFEISLLLHLVHHIVTLYLTKQQIVLVFIFVHGCNLKL